MFIKNLYRFLAVLTIAIFNRARLSSGYEIYEANVSQIFDLYLPILRQKIIYGGLDPVELPDFTVDQLTLPGRIEGNISLDHGWLQELSTIRRPGDMILKYSSKSLIFNVSLGWDTLDFTYQYFLRVFRIDRNGKIFGRVHDLDLRIIILLDLVDYELQLQHFRFTNVGKFFVGHRGSAVDKIINAITKLIVSIFKEKILRKVELKIDPPIILNRAKYIAPCDLFTSVYYNFYPGVFLRAECLEITRTR